MISTQLWGDTSPKRRRSLAVTERSWPPFALISLMGHGMWPWRAKSKRGHSSPVRWFFAHRPRFGILAPTIGKSTQAVPQNWSPAIGSGTKSGRWLQRHDCHHEWWSSSSAALSVTSSGGAAFSVTSSVGAALPVTSSGGAALSVTSSGGAALSVPFLLDATSLSSFWNVSVAYLMVIVVSENDALAQVSSCGCVALLLYTRVYFESTKVDYQLIRDQLIITLLLRFQPKFFQVSLAGPRMVLCRA